MAPFIKIFILTDYWSDCVFMLLWNCFKYGLCFECVEQQRRYFYFLSPKNFFFCVRNQSTGAFFEDSFLEGYHLNCVYRKLNQYFITQKNCKLASVVLPSYIEVDIFWYLKNKSCFTLQPSSNIILLESSVWWVPSHPIAIDRVKFSCVMCQLYQISKFLFVFMLFLISKLKVFFSDSFFVCFFEYHENFSRNPII